MIYYGRAPKVRLGLISPKWERRNPPDDMVFIERLPPGTRGEITRIWGFTLFGFFVGVQKYVVGDAFDRRAPWETGDE